MGGCNLLWAAVKNSLEFGVPSLPTLTVIGFRVVSLPRVIAIGLLVLHFRSGGKLPPMNGAERQGFAAIVLVSAAACYLLWIWVRIPPEAGNPALSVMSVFGFGVVALPTVFLIGFTGIHLFSARKPK